MGSMCLLLVSFTCVCLCVCECVHVSYIHPILSLTLLSDLLPLVIIAMVVGYIDKDNKYASSDVKFAIAIGSIIPLSYYIGMGIARSVHLNKPFVDFKYISTVFTLTKNVKRYKPFFHEVPLMLTVHTLAPCSISAQSNFAVGAVVNASFGSITELTFYITALLRGHQAANTCLQEIVKSALTGTLLGCILFIPVSQPAFVSHFTTSNK